MQCSPTPRRRYKGCNSRKFCQPDNAGLALLKNAMEKLELSARAYNRILKVFHSIADLDGSDVIKPYQLAEAINYRNLDRGRLGRMSIIHPLIHHG